MAVLEVLTYDHPVLKKNCRKIRHMSDELKTLARDMGETMFEYRGIGLSANQVGSEYRLIVVYNWDVEDEESEEERYKVYVNPRIVKRSDELEYSEEGCLSFPYLIGTVARSVEVEVVAQDLDMKKVKLKAQGLRARLFQHETDHLNGITFIERVEEGTLRRVDEEPEEGEEETGEEMESAGEPESTDSKPDGAEPAPEAVDTSEKES